MHGWLADAAVVEAVLVSFLIALVAASASLRWLFLLMPLGRKHSIMQHPVTGHFVGSRHGSSGEHPA